MDVFRDSSTFKDFFQFIEPHLMKKKDSIGRKLRLMEVCGSHTVAFSKSGMRQLLAPYVDLISGPGCPVCVTDQKDIDHMIAYSKEVDVMVATFGDMMKVPGTYSTLYKERANGADIRIIYSPSQAVKLAEEYPHKRVVLLGVGFETTAPSVALSVKKAYEKKLDNYFVYSAHKLTPPAVEMLVEDSDHNLDGFILPGHVSVIIGRRGWLSLKGVPSVISGFEPLDLITSVYQLSTHVERENDSIQNNYKRTVREQGNVKAQEIVDEVFEPSAVSWRGFGRLQESGLDIRGTYRAFDAKEQFTVKKERSRERKGCRCGEIVKGKENPHECALFYKACTPQQPLGPCMVSSEGTCATYYQYETEKI